MKIENLLDEVKRAKELKSDGELARTLGVSKQAVSRYYLGERAPDEFACLKIAEILDMPLDTVIATVKAASEKDETRRAAWENYMKRLGGLAASVVITLCVSVTMIVTSTPGNALPVSVSGRSQFVLCKRRRADRVWSQVKAILRRIGQKCTFGVFVGRVAQIAA